ncbi:MAG: hypothetical protein HQM08_19510 [Candidatus Riflebacteria bacterium]|nr:hypothetical protein [Candidatus Riflebacteria bacterium]
MIWKVFDSRTPRLAVNATKQTIKAKSEDLPPKTASILGNVYIDQILAPKGINKVTEFQKVQMRLSDSCLVKYPDNRTIQLDGQGEFLCCQDGTKIPNCWKGKMSFGKHKNFYKVYLPVATLAIRGTVIHLDSGLSSTKCWVEKGVIEWKACFSKDSGTLSAGQGVTVFASGTQLLTNSPLSDSPKKIASTPVEKIFSAPTSSGKSVPSESKNATSPEQTPDAFPAQGEQLEEFMKE